MACAVHKMAAPTPVNHLQCNAVKEKIVVLIIWLLQLRDYPSCANSKNVESLINTQTLKKHCALALRTEVKQTQEL